MEVLNGDKNKFAVLITEFFGTLFFSLAFNLQGNEGTVMMPLVLYSLIIITGDISGGHMNPAVTVGVYIERKKYCKNFLFMVLIIIVQTVGALCAQLLGFLVRVTLNDSENPGKLYWVPGQ